MAGLSPRCAGVQHDPAARSAVLRAGGGTAATAATQPKMQRRTRRFYSTALELDSTVRSNGQRDSAPPNIHPGTHTRTRRGSTGRPQPKPQQSDPRQSPTTSQSINQAAPSFPRITSATPLLLLLGLGIAVRRACPRRRVDDARRGRDLGARGRVAHPVRDANEAAVLLVVRWG